MDLDFNISASRGTKVRIRERIDEKSEPLTETF